ncbi:MAG: transglutaminase domain-containing protein [Chitinophagaceae bacterium]|nr:transglutaminase domain-containing protein [Chitinophagaceae bacterium]
MYRYDAMEELNRRHKFASNFILNLVGLLTIIPLAPLINRVIPPILIGKWNADLVVAILLAYLFVRFVLWVFKPLIIPAFVMVCVVVVFNILTSTYNLQSMVNDYKRLVQQSWDNKDRKEKDLYLIKPSLFDSEVDKAVKGLKSKINYKDSLVRNFAVKHSLDYFDDYYSKYGADVRFLSLFKYLNNHFKYVSDAQRDEYYATARETIENGLGGDCDDHTILMISCLKAIGARCRMVLTVDHVYPELHCGDKKSFLLIQEAITDLFASENFSGLFYREENGEYWINLDYSARHPGGPYADNKAYAIVNF